MAQPVYVAGVGMARFRKPSEGAGYVEMGEEACRAALADAAIDYKEIKSAFASFVFGDTCCGQRVIYGIGLTGIPIVNLNNACASGSSAIYQARQAILAGMADCVLALGFEQMARGPLARAYGDRASPFDRHNAVIGGGSAEAGASSTTFDWFAASANEYMQETGAKPETFAEITVKSRRHAKHNPYAVFRDETTVEEVMASKMMTAPLTKLQCSAPTSGAAAAILCSQDFARRHGIKAPAILGQAMITDFPSSFGGSYTKMIGYDMAEASGKAAYTEAGLGPKDIQVAEMHDCFTSNEVITYEALGFAGKGQAEKFVRDRQNTYGGSCVINPSGGLLSKGHPIGATGLGQCAELTWQLRGAAGARQVDGARVALQHNLGIGGACVVTIYGRA